MKRTKALLLSLLLLVTLLFSACGDGEVKQNDNSPEINQPNIVTEIDEADDSQAEEKYQYNENSEDKQNIAYNSQINNQPSENKQTQEPQVQKSFSLADVPAYNGKAYVAINNNEPFFTQADYTTKSFEHYSKLDALGRCGVAFANVGQNIMPTEGRGDISSITPSGWKNKNYGDLIDGGYLYNRCHLLGFQLTGENANEKNLITGTRYLNIEGMLPFENMVADYVKETGNHVLYRVTPVFEGDNLLASGVLMEGYSIEDEGEGINFCVYCYNVQPGIVIDYATGESYAESSDELLDTAQTHQPTPEPALPTSAVTPTAQQPQTADYILNTNTHKFHYPDCSSVKSMKESNKEYFSGSRDEIIARGYESCKRCTP